MGASPMLAQTAGPIPTPAAALTPEQRVEKVKNDVREVKDKLAALTVPLDIEPSFRFVA
jgi:hypothetical protein